MVQSIGLVALAVLALGAGCEWEHGGVEAVAPVGDCAPTTELSCDGKDNDCDGLTDEGCDKDGDNYCSAAMKVTGGRTVCPATKLSKDGDAGDDCNDDPAKGGAGVNPGQTEQCANGVDENCGGGTDEGCPNANGCLATGSGASCGGGKGSCVVGLCQYTDGHGYKWTLVPAGKFWMGCNSKVDLACSFNANENPQHEVELSAYWIGVHEVTAAVYEKCVTAGASSCTAPSKMGGVNYYTYGVAGKEQHPVTYLNWTQSEAVCKWLGGDLPTEAQWEKAARGGCEVYSGKDCKTTEVKYPWGSGEPVCGAHAVYNQGDGTCGQVYTTYAVGAGSPQGASPYGAYDMAGNVWELTKDWYDIDFYGTTAATVKEPWNAASASGRVFRGGSFDGGVSSLRAGFRIGWYGATEDVGVRCARPFP